MTASRIEPQKVSDLASVQVQASWNGVDITEANGGVFEAPIAFVGGLWLVNWVMRFPVLTGSGTSLAFKLQTTGMPILPAQYPGVFTQSGLSTNNVYFQDGYFSATWAMIQNRSTTLRAVLSTTSLNY